MLEKENEKLRESGINASQVSGSTQGGYSDQSQEITPRKWYQARPKSDWDLLECSMCHRLIKDITQEAGEVYYQCDAYCKKVFCGACQYKNRTEFMQHPPLSVQKMAYYKNFEKINESFNENWDPGC